MEVPAVDQGDVDVDRAQHLGRAEASEAAADDDDARPPAARSLARAGCGIAVRVG
jgi:hypothetical protein